MQQQITTCRFCQSAAVARFSLSHGCIAAPGDREQALCVNHMMRATPLGAMTLREVLLPSVLAEWRVWQAEATF